ncbi:MAG: hypothetical protein FWE48_06325 [Coriobacteriia bacterium]|nr:hypothetical protein [Coriobacteriia bacterium]MCL2746680.1 hypothetical protein [Coriobacteriia bacterium]MCL2870474.1 hypothetical protein [Coriobacteriia bacterium]
MNTPKTANFTTIPILSTLACLLPVALYIAMWNRLPDQMQANMMTDALTLPTVVVAFVVPALILAVHLVTVFTTINRAKGENNPKLLWALWLTPAVAIVANVALIMVNI